MFFGFQMRNKMILFRNKLFQCKKRQPSNEEIYRLYNLFRNRVNREIKKSKTNYYSGYFENNKSNIKKDLGMNQIDYKHRKF